MMAVVIFMVVYRIEKRQGGDTNASREVPHVSLDPCQGMGSDRAFGPVTVRARNLRGLDGLCFLCW